MAHPIKELARMTTKSKQIDGMGFGGIAPDVNEVSGALAMAHPQTGKKLSRPAYYLARYIYADDKDARVHIKASALHHILQANITLDKTIAMRLVGTALREISTPIMRLNRKTREQELRPISKSEICRQLKIKGNKLPAKLEEAYSIILDQMFIWNQEALSHVSAQMKEEEAA